MKIFTPALVLIFAACVALFSPSCTKHDDDPANSSPATQNWKLDTTAYAITRVSKSNNLFYAVGPVGLLSFSFASLPVVSGTYIVGDPHVSTANVAIEARTGNDYAGLSGIVVVTVTAGKITVDAGNIPMIPIPYGKDTALLSAHLTEQ